MDLELVGKAAIVTGGSRGIGKAIALGLAAEGANVAICARDGEALREAEAELRALGVDALGVVADVTKAGDAAALVRAAAERFGRIDVLVNNVGGADAADTDEAWIGAFERNLLAAVRCCREAVPEMRKEGGGSIIHVASIWGREAGGSLTYNAAKAAVISHAKNLALQLAHEGIRVNSIAPGSIRFPGGSWDRRAQADPAAMDDFVARNIASRRFGRVDEVANVAVFLASVRASWVTGACINIDGGQTHSNI